MRLTRRAWVMAAAIDNSRLKASRSAIIVSSGYASCPSAAPSGVGKPKRSRHKLRIVVVVPSSAAADSAVT